MKNTIRIPQAPVEPMPELAEFLRPFHVHFLRSEGRHALDRYLTGLLTELPNKNCDTIAASIPGTSEQQLQGLLSTTAWDEEDLNRQRVQQMLQLPSEGDGVLIFDDTGFAKQGTCSVGVARQYSGTLGKKANCQVTVNCHYAERTVAWPVATRLYLPRHWAEDPMAWPVATRLYLPRHWAEDPTRRRRAHVPAEVTFQTKPQIALDLLDHARAWGVRYSCVTADADYGDNPSFLDGLEQRRQHYVVAVRADFTVAVSRAGVTQRADALIAAQPSQSWRSITYREGSKGWLRGRFVAVRCWRKTAAGRRRIGWLIGEDAADGKRRYYWSNFRAGMPLEAMVEYAHRRHWVEQYHEEAKGLLGWDQYQGRRWRGFHRHAVSVMLAYSFLVWQEWRERQERARPGRPRRAFSPSARSASHHLAGGASADLRLVTP